MEYDQARVCPVLCVVIPCYNEEEVLPETSRCLLNKLELLIREGKISSESRVVLADDGSSDGTWDQIRFLHDEPGNKGLFTGFSLAHNRGHQSVLYAGLMLALERGCDVAISMDADLQDDPDAMDTMLAEYSAGANIVYGVRDNRDSDTGFKRGTAHVFYALMRALGTEVIVDSADYRLMDAKALEALSHYKEANLFLRGIVPSMGFRTAKVYYRRGARMAGESKYPLKKMLGFAIDGITSFSVVPLRLVTFSGFLFMFVSIIAFAYVLVSLVAGTAASGWASLHPRWRSKVCPHSVLEPRQSLRLSLRQRSVWRFRLFRMEWMGHLPCMMQSAFLPMPS